MRLSALQERLSRNGNSLLENLMIKRAMTVALLVLLGSRATMAGEDLAKGFISPPDSARPWAYGFFLNGNITRDGITADLEAMKRVGHRRDDDHGSEHGHTQGARGVWQSAVARNIQASVQRGGPARTASEHAQHGQLVRQRRALDHPGVSMQKVVFSETPLQGPGRRKIALPQPEAVAGFYRDIAVLAIPATPTKVVTRNQVLNLTAKFKDGWLAWDVPEGAWVVIRFGHTSTGANNPWASEAGRGLECDKLSKEALDVHFNHFVAKLIADVGPLIPKTFVSTHIDSWECGGQNWTGASARNSSGSRL